VRASIVFAVMPMGGTWSQRHYTAANAHRSCDPETSEPSLSSLAIVSVDGLKAMLGRNIGHYKLIAELGAGGMGLVYRAQDLKLGREVALKFMAPELAQDRKASERFKREARAAAAINHPNICTVYEVGEHEGQPFIAMELLDGESLEKRIGNQPLALESLLDWASQIANGLEAAHERGILHRDIKPGNLFVTSRGDVKILDFGLAKQAPETRPAADIVRQSEITTVEHLTDAGKAAGTPNYMSPEQARGEDLDERTDLFSVGAVLYEMATGKKPFRGANPGVVLGAILHEQPPSPVKLNPELPEDLERIIQKALEKDRDFRYQHAAEIRADLRRLRRDTSSQQKVVRRQSATNITLAAPSVSPEGRPRSKAVFAIITAIVLVALGLFFPVLRKKTGPAFQTLTIERLTHLGSVLMAAISRDGKYVAYVAGIPGKGGLWVRQVATQSDIQIQPPTAGTYEGLTFSNDGNYLYFTRDNGDGRPAELFQVPVIGGERRKVSSGVDSGITFSPDGQRFAFLREATADAQQLIVAGVDGGAEQVIAERSGTDEFYGYGVGWSPDGRLIAASAFSGGQCFVMTVPASGGPLKKLGVKGWQYIQRVAWLPDSSGVIVIAGETRTSPEQIWLISYPSAAIRRITNDLSNYTDLSLTGDGHSLAVVQADTVSNIWTVPDARAALASQLTFGVGTQDGIYGLAWAPDGRTVYAATTSGSRELWMAAPGGRPRQITFDSDLGFFSTPSLCPDGHTVVFGAGPLGNASIWKVDVEGGKPTSITSGGTQGAPSCAPDGKWVYFNRLGKSFYTLWRIPIQGGNPEQLTTYSSTFPIVSPDGKWVAFRLGDPNRTASGIIPSAGGQPVKTFDFSFFAPGGDVVMRWSPAGDAVDYIDIRNGIANIWRQRLSGGEPKQLTDFSPGLIFNFVWLPNGRDLAVALGNSTSDVVRFRDFETRR